MKYQFPDYKDNLDQETLNLIKYAIDNNGGKSENIISISQWYNHRWLVLVKMEGHEPIKPFILFRSDLPLTKQMVQEETFGRWIVEEGRLKYLGN